MWKYNHILQTTINGDGVKNLNILLHDGYVLYLSHLNDELQLLIYEYELLIYKLNYFRSDGNFKTKVC